MTREELVRNVVGYEELYTVDIFGNVINKITKKELVQHYNKFGYANVMLYKDGKQKQHKVHRLIAEAFIPNPNNKPHVNHIDGDKAHNVVWNLEWATPKENNVHASDTGLIRTARRAKYLTRWAVVQEQSVEMQGIFQDACTTKERTLTKATILGRLNHVEGTSDSDVYGDKRLSHTREPDMG